MMNTTNNSFTPDEWKTLVDTPVTVGEAVMLSAPSGLVGVTKEVTALSNSIRDLMKRDLNRTSPLLNELGKQLEYRVDITKQIGDTLFTQVQALAKRPTEDIRAKALAACHEASYIIDRISPTDAAAYKQFVLSVAQRVAEAASEGGIMGIGGEKVSPAEQAMINDVASALGMRT